MPSPSTKKLFRLVPGRRGESPCVTNLVFVAPPLGPEWHRISRGWSDDRVTANQMEECDMPSRSKIVIGLAAAAVSLSALVPAAQAAAAPKPTGHLKFCNVSHAYEYIEFPARHTTTVAFPPGGPCHTVDLYGGGQEQIVAHRHVNGLWPAVATRWISDNGNTTWRV